jgi:hypothetical protein
MKDTSASKIPVIYLFEAGRDFAFLFTKVSMSPRNTTMTGIQNLPRTGRKWTQDIFLQSVISIKGEGRPIEPFSITKYRINRKTTMRLLKVFTVGLLIAIFAAQALSAFA